MNLRSCAVIIAAFFTLSIAYAIRYGYGMLLPGMIESLAISKTEAGVIYAAYFVAYTICSPILGLLSDRCDSRVILTFFPALMAAGAFLMSFADSLPKAIVFFVLAGVGHAACWAPVVALVQRRVSDKHRGKALALATTGSGVGIAAWGLMLPWIVAGDSWQAGWFYMGVFGFCVACMNYILIRKQPPDAAEIKTTAPGTSQAITYSQILTSKPLWFVGFSYLLIGFTVLVPFTFLSLYAAEELGQSYGDAARLFTLLALAGMGGKIVLGTLSDRGRIPVMMMCGCLLAAGCWGVVNFEAYELKITSVILIGIGFGAVWPVYAAAAMDFFPRSAAGAVIGLWTVFLGIGSIISPIICGWTIDFSGSYDWAFNIGFAAALLSAVLLIPGLKMRGHPCMTG